MKKTRPPIFKFDDDTNMGVCFEGGGAQMVFGDSRTRWDGAVKDLKKGVYPGPVPIKTEHEKIAESIQEENDTADKKYLERMRIARIIRNYAGAMAGMANLCGSIWSLWPYMASPVYVEDPDLTWELNMWSVDRD